MEENKEVIYYNDFCLSKECLEYIEWDAGYGSCVSCKLVGQSYDITEYPQECPFLEEIKDYKQTK